MPVLLDPSKKLPTVPPKIKYFQDGIDGAMTPPRFHLGVSWFTYGSSQVFVSILKMKILWNCVEKFHPPKTSNLSLFAKIDAVCPPLGSGGVPFVAIFYHLN